MKIKIILFASLFIIGFSYSTFSQNDEYYRHAVKIGTQFPLQHDISYEFFPDEHFSSEFQIGILTRPYSDVILSIMEAFGTDEAWTNLVDDAFEYGTIFTLTPKYHFKKSYAGFFGQMIILNGYETPFSAFGAYYGINTSPMETAIPIGNHLNVTLESQLFNLGLVYGRHFYIIKDNPQWCLTGEISLAKTITSKNYFESNMPVLDETLGEPIYDKMDSELNETYQKYAIIPTLNIHLAYKFGL